mmetsp:Transcript_65689/g.170972  ORF Transcript_65689/g.170972 Transcript_65689/m.170972 type:complete len:245 (+) Transcript_65689:196-930(+)
MSLRDDDPLVRHPPGVGPHPVVLEKLQPVSPRAEAAWYARPQVPDAGRRWLPAPDLEMFEKVVLHRQPARYPLHRELGTGSHAANGGEHLVAVHFVLAVERDARLHQTDLGSIFEANEPVPVGEHGQGHQPTWAEGRRVSQSSQDRVGLDGILRAVWPVRAVPPPGALLRARGAGTAPPPDISDLGVLAVVAVNHAAHDVVVLALHKPLLIHEDLGQLVRDKGLAIDVLIDHELPLHIASHVVH